MTQLPTLTWHRACLTGICSLHVSSLTMKTSRFFRVLLSVSLLLLAPSLASAESADGYIKGKYDTIMGSLGKPASRARDEAVSRHIQDSFDFGALARDALGATEWDKRTDTERTEFRDLLEKLVKESYRKSLQQTLGYTMTIKGQSEAGGRIKVSTVVEQNCEAKKCTTKKPPTAIEYVLVAEGATFKIVDVIIEKSSLVQNYNSQFRRTIRTDGFPKLLERMKRKLAKTGGG